MVCIEQVPFWFLQNNYCPVSATTEIEFQVDSSPSSCILHSALLCLPCVCKEKEPHMEANSASYCSLCLEKAGTSFQSRETDFNPSSSGSNYSWQMRINTSTVQLCPLLANDSTKHNRGNFLSTASVLSCFACKSKAAMLQKKKSGVPKHVCQSLQLEWFCQS